MSRQKIALILTIEQATLLRRFLKHSVGVLDEKHGAEKVERPFCVRGSFYDREVVSPLLEELEAQGVPDFAPERKV